MQNLDNDMEELFREAAENYPLRITGADWSKVQAALQQEPPVKEGKASRKKWWWSSLLLLLVPFICTRLQYNGSQTAMTLIAAKTTTSFNKQTNNHTTIQPSGNSSTASNRLSFLLSPIVIKQKAIEASGNSAIPSTNNDQPLSANDQPTTANQQRPTNNDQLHSHQTIKPFSTSSKTTTAITAPVAEEDDINEIQPSLTIQTAKQDDHKKDTASVAATDNNKEKEKQPVTHPTTASAKQKQPSYARFYVSVLGGAGISKVKASKFEPAGASAGVSVGYNITKRFAVEAGALWSTKNYSTRYKYFNNSKTQWPSVRIIETVNGSCQMIEIPVSLRYNFKPTAKHSFFAAAGLSSWIMKKEDYNYTYTTLLNPMQKSMYKSYYNSGSNWFSVVQLSAGWQRNIGKLGAVRMQPYYNLPLHGVGLGSLPVSGFGVMAGFSFSLR